MAGRQTALGPRAHLRVFNKGFGTLGVKACLAFWGFIFVDWGQGFGQWVEELLHLPTLLQASGSLLGGLAHLELILHVFRTEVYVFQIPDMV